MASRSILSKRTAPILVLMAAAPLLLLLRPDFLEPLAAYLFIAVIWVSLIPPFFYLRDLPERALPLMPLSCGFYIIFFAIPPFIIERRWWSAAADATGSLYGLHFESITALTAGLVLAGVTALIAAYCFAEPVLRSRLWRLRLPRDVSSFRLRIILWALAGAHIIFLYTPAARSAGPLVQAMSPIGLFAVGMLFMVGLRGQMHDAERVFFWIVLIPLEALIHVYEGLLTPILILFTFLLTLYLHFFRKLSILLAVVVLFGLYIFPVLKLSNIFIIDEAATGMGRISDKVSAIGLAATFFSDPSNSRVVVAGMDKNVVAPVVRRLALVVVLQYCVDQTPVVIPYLKGETLRNLATNLIPRVLWKDKPTEMMGQWFGHRYQILQPADRITSINLPWLIEFYINFGPIGIVLGMAAVGLLLAVLEVIFLQPGASLLESVAGWALVFRLSYPESNMSLMFGGLVTQVVFLCVMIYVLLRLGRVGQRTEVSSS